MANSQLKMLKSLRSSMVGESTEENRETVKRYIFFNLCYRNHCFYRMAELYETLNHKDKRAVHRFMPGYITKDSSSGSEDDNENNV